MSVKTTHPVTRSAFGVAALVAIAVLANWLVSLTPLGNRGADFTENKVHTLSTGTRAILTELDTPVVIRYYASRNTDYMPEELKLHMRRVDDLLKEYSSLSKGKLRIENLDPEPDTDAEDSANLDGINGQRMDDQNLYFGLAISCLDKTSVIPFIDPRAETMLEYQISKAIAEVSTPTKPKIGLMTALDLQGAPAMMPGQQPTPGWVIYQQLKQSFDVVDVPMDSTTIDPKEIKVLLHVPPRRNHSGSRVRRGPIRAQRRHRRRRPGRLFRRRTNDRAAVEPDDGPATSAAHHLHTSHPAFHLGRHLRVQRRFSQIPPSPPSSAVTVSASRSSPLAKTPCPERTTSSPRISAPSPCFYPVPSPRPAAAESLRKPSSNPPPRPVSWIP